MAKYRKKPIVVEAFQWKGEADESEDPPWFTDARGVGVVRKWGPDWTIKTLEGRMTVISGDWIIQGIKGELYPIKDDIFRETYDLVDEDADEPEYVYRILDSRVLGAIRLADEEPDCTHNYYLSPQFEANACRHCGFMGKEKKAVEPDETDLAASSVPKPTNIEPAF